MSNERWEAGGQSFSLRLALQRNEAQTRSGTTVRVVSFVPEAVQPLVVFNSETREIDTYSSDGAYFPNGEFSCMDLVTRSNQ